MRSIYSSISFGAQKKSLALRREKKSRGRAVLWLETNWRNWNECISFAPDCSHIHRSRCGWRLNVQCKGETFISILSIHFKLSLVIFKSFQSSNMYCFTPRHLLAQDTFTHASASECLWAWMLIWRMIIIIIYDFCYYMVLLFRTMLLLPLTFCIPFGRRTVRHWVCVRNIIYTE